MTDAADDLQRRLSALKRYRSNLICEAGSQRVVDLDGPWAIVDPTSEGWFPSQNLNRVIDLYTSVAPKDETIRRAMAVYECLPRHFAYIDSCPDADAWFEALSAHGYRLGNEMAVLARNLGSVSIEPSPFDTGEASVEETTTVLTGDDHAVIWRDATVGLIGRPGCAMFAAREGGVTVAVAGITAHAGVAYLSNAFTLPEHRGRGAQTALIRARLVWAKEQGCDHAFSETYAWLPSSYANLQRCGFEPFSNRQILRFEADPRVREKLQHTLHGHARP